MAKTVIVDDDDVTTAIVTEFLEADGHVVIPVHNGDDAVRAIVEQEAELAILDQVLPGRSGMQILAELRALPDAIDRPIMMLTGRRNRLHIEFADQGGADDYLTKPFVQDALRAKVHALLKGGTISRSARGGDASIDAAPCRDHDGMA